MGAVVPHQGKYAVQLVDEKNSHPSTAFVGVDGTLSWVQMEGYEPQFMNFLYHIG
jgi:hypothetical protein